MGRLGGVSRLSQDAAPTHSGMHRTNGEEYNFSPQFTHQTSSEGDQACSHVLTLVNGGDARRCG